MAKRYYWLKLPEGFFRQKPIKKLRRIAGGDTYTIIYLKLLLEAIKNDGYIFYDGVEDDFFDELALEFDEEYDNVKVTVSFLIAQGLMKQISEDQYLLEAANEMTGSETSSAKRVREFRKKALHCNTDVTDGNKVKQNCNGEIEIENREKSKELEVREELEEDIHMSGSEEPVPVRKRINYQEVVNLYNTICVDLPQVIQLNDTRKKKIASRLKSFSIDQIKLAFEKAQASDFMTGRAGEWKASFDWLMKSDTNLTKVLEGNYDNHPERQRGTELENYAQQLARWADD